MGLKREHRDNLNKFSKEQEVALFNVRGEHAQRLLEANDRIAQLEETVAKLTQELERYKTLSDIQVRHDDILEMGKNRIILNLLVHSYIHESFMILSLLI